MTVGSLQKRTEQLSYFLAGFACYDQSSFCFVEKRSDMCVLGQLQKLAAPEIFTKMCYSYIGCHRCIFIKVGIIKSPVVRKIRTDQHYITGFELFDAVADKLCA